MKYLDVILDKKLIFNAYLNYAESKSKMALGQLSSLVNRRSKLFINNNLLLYKSVILPQITYAFESCMVNRLLQNSKSSKTFRIVFNALWFVRNKQCIAKQRYHWWSKPSKRWRYALSKKGSHIQTYFSEKLSSTMKLEHRVAKDPKKHSSMSSLSENR